MILKIKGDWREVLNDCRATVGKEPLDREPSEAFKKQILISEHSPIRGISVKWVWPQIKSWIATHFSRHKWECFIRTQRDDRTGGDRHKLPQDAPVSFVGEANVQHLIDTSRKRLCRMSARETRETWEALKRDIHKIEPEISDVMVPNCIYRCGCPEMGNCSFFNHFLMLTEGDDIMDIQKRYDAYNRIFRRARKEEG